MNYKILIVDDEQLERRALESIIVLQLGTRVEIMQAVNGRDAVQMAREFRPDIAFLDIKMPIMNGIEAGKEILEFLPDCYIIMLTGFTYFTYAKESVNIGAADFLVKPAADEDVVKALEKATREVESRIRKRIDDEENRKKVRRAEQYMEGELGSAIACNNADEELIQAQMEELGIQFHYGVGVVVRAQARGPENPHSTAKLCKRCISRLELDGRICYCEHYHNFYLLLLTDESRSRDWYKELFKRFSVIAEESGIQVKVAVGIQVSKLKNIYLSFQEAKRNINSDKRIHIHRHQIGNGESKLTQREQERKLIAYLKTGNYDEAMLYLEQLMEQFFEEDMEPMMKIYELLVVINRSLPQNLEIMPVFTLFEQMSGESGREQIMSLASQYVEHVVDALIAEESMMDTAWASRAEDYIQANYSRNITLEDMAGHTGFSIYYFSKLFKQQFQMNFVDYLTKVRIEKAKMMLHDEQASVKEVGRSVGYSEAGYFSRVFKKETGVPPSVYQKSAKRTKMC